MEDPVEVSVEQKLVALYTLQQVDSKIDEIRAYRGNLPLEIQDMEDEIAGLETRIANFKEESKKHQKDIADYKIKIKETEALIKKYEEQQNNVRNNREYETASRPNTNLTSARTRKLSCASIADVSLSTRASSHNTTHKLWESKTKGCSIRAAFFRLEAHLERGSQVALELLLCDGLDAQFACIIEEEMGLPIR